VVNCAARTAPVARFWRLLVIDLPWNMGKSGRAGESMPKMTPEQEADYALNYNLPRSSLKPDVQEAYDRLVERRMNEVPEPISVADAQGTWRQAFQDAKKALADGRRVFLCRMPMEYDPNKGADGTSGMAGASSLIESVENLGWRLDQMSWVRVSVKVEGIFLFRRDTSAQSG
jgi:hypothetical protein